MWVHLFSILGLALLCAGWVLFQLWLKRLDPVQGNAEKSCGSCGGCSREPEEGSNPH